ncbi:MAG: hypothetical protein WCK39_08505 [Methanomassiliicoccales archaeon]
MVLCKSCGLEIHEAMLFCPNCGSKREKATLPSDQQSLLRVIPCRVGSNSKWTPAAALLSNDSISLFLLPEARESASPLRVFLPPSGYLPNMQEANRAAEAKTPDILIEVDDVQRADLSYVQMEGEELYSLKIQLEASALGLRLPMDKVYRDILMKMLDKKLHW